MSLIKKSFLPTSEEKTKRLRKAQSWCFKNKIIIYPKAISNTQVKIAVKIKRNKEVVGDIIYEQKPKGRALKYWEKINELYLDYYNKNN